MKVDIKSIECLRCYHKWIPRKTPVRLCPKCKSPYFDTIRVKDYIEPEGKNKKWTRKVK
jgi:Zn finger protein HypA/HybF involved in hydrogenase expression